MSEETNTKLLDNTEKVPSVIRVSKLLKARAEEICSLENRIMQKTGTKLIFQKLPVHMRRRAMSHKVKRLPRRLREAHARQIDKSGATVSTKKCRKHRRRPEHLLTAYNRRKRNNIWLETHIWHAKRFHMINKWNYRLAERPCDKSFRACYRASAKHCLIQDISYFGCIEIKGPEDFLIANFKQVTNTAVGLTINARTYRNGAREGRTILYHQNKYPFNAIGEICFVWKPNIAENESSRTVWIWIHPSYYSEAKQCFINLFKLDSADGETKTVCHNAEGVQLKELKDTLNRFRLTGPLAHSVIKSALSVAPHENKTEWFQRYLDSSENKSFFEQQVSYWELLQKINYTTELSPHVVYNTIVVDPRYKLPPKKTKAIASNQETVEIEINEFIKHGTIWNEEIRSEAENNLCTSILIAQRKTKVVPDDSVPNTAPVIPVMLVQQPGNKDASNQLGYCTGWDIIIPSSWGRAFWITFIMRGARAGGLREFKTLRFEQNQTDILAPDTEAGRKDESEMTKSYLNTFFRLPPKNRVNYNKLGVVTPFYFRWKTLIQEWNPNSNFEDNFYVVRDRKLLQNLQEVICDKSNVRNIEIDLSQHCLVPVSLNLIKKGRIKRFALICLPNADDIKLKHCPVEPLHKDDNQKVRKEVRDSHKKLLKKLRRQRLKDKRDGKESSVSTADIVKEQAEKMQSLWLPEPNNIRNSCQREVFGFVTYGDFSFSSAHGRCIGYVVLNGLTTLVSQENKNLVFVRDINSRQYRLAKISILYD